MKSTLQQRHSSVLS